MKVLVIGAGGIVGQHMMLQQPDDVKVIYTRRKSSLLYDGLDLEDYEATTQFLDNYKPNVVVNLAGENRVDVVQNNPQKYEALNGHVPGLLADWCDRNKAHLIQVSTQGVFSGSHAPYSPEDSPHPVNKYGQQKAMGEASVRRYGSKFTIARLTFVLGTRPFAGIGRVNPFELMISEEEQVQVDDHYFSPVFAADAAAQLWKLVEEKPSGTVHIGEPNRQSRFSISQNLGWVMQMAGETPPKVHRVSHNHFKGIAPRPHDTTWQYGSMYDTKQEEAIMNEWFTYKRREKMDLDKRSFEIEQFLGNAGVKERLAQGFWRNHALVAQDFKGAKTDVNTPSSLLSWYRNTTAYIYELSAYHLDKDLDYMNMCWGLATHLANKGKSNVLAIGDGIGDLTLELAKNPQLSPTYNDLADSKTAEFAQYRFELNHPEPIPTDLTYDWIPDIEPGAYDAVIALDFFEHLVNVEEWVRAVYAALKPGGLFLAENSFGIGDAEHGDSIPMHLSTNNKYRTEWDNVLRGVGFTESGEGEWWAKN